MSVEPLLSSRDVERLVLNTCTKSPTSMSGSAPPASQERSYIDFKLLIDPPLPSATITDLCNEPLFHSGYLSEEEDMSSDDMSFSSGSTAEDLLDDTETNFPELLAEDCTFVEQQCNQAEAVVMVSPGKPRMVRVSRVDLSSPAVKRPSSSSSRNNTRSSSRLSILSLRSFSQEGSLSSSSPRIPSTPSLDAGSQTPSSLCGPSTPKTPNSYFESPARPTTYSAINVTPTPKPRTRNPYRLKLPHLSKRGSDIQIRKVDAPISAPLTAPAVYKPSMMPRGADERGPKFEVPSFPQPPKSARPWMLRKDTFGPLGKEQQRQSLVRAESGSLPSWG